MGARQALKRTMDVLLHDQDEQASSPCKLLWTCPGYRGRRGAIPIIRPNMKHIYSFYSEYYVICI